MTAHWDNSMCRKIVLLALLDTFAFAYLAGAAIYTLEAYVSPLAEPFRDARHFLVPPVRHAVVVTAVVLLLTVAVRAAIGVGVFRVDVMLRLGVRCTARLPLMLGLVCFATGFALFIANESMGTLGGSDWFGPPPEQGLIDAISAAAFFCCFVLSPLAYYVAWRSSRRLRRCCEHALDTYCHACGYDRTGLGDGAVCPECGRADERDNAKKD